MRLGEDISIGLVLDGKEFSVQVRNAGTLLRELRQNLNITADAGDRFKRKVDDMGTGFRHFMIMASTARFALLDFYDVFLRLPASIIKTSGEVERLTKLMEGLSDKSDEAARKQEALANTKFIFDSAKNAPFEVKALADAFVKLKTGGIDPTNGSFKALTDSVAKFGGNSDVLHRASVAIQQMAGKGVISMEELRQQLGEAVPNAMKMMATGMGMSMKDLTKAISNGEVESKQALSRMFAVMRFENDGAAAAMMNTWVGTIERLKTTWTLFQVEMGGSGLFDEAKNQVNQLIDSLDGASFRQLGSDLGFVAAEGVKAFGGMINFVKEFYDQIKLTGELMVAYFFTSRAMSGTGNVFKKIAEDYKANLDSVNKAIERNNETATKNHYNRIVQAEQNIAKMKIEAAENQAVYAQMARNHQNYTQAIQLNEQALAKMRKTLTMEGASVAVLNAQKTLNALKEEAAQVARTGAEYGSKAAVLRQTIAAQEQHVIALKGQTVATGQLTMASKVLEGTKAVGGAMWTALGGFIGIATMALSYGIIKWMEYASAAEKAMERATNAANGISTLASKKQVELELKGEDNKIKGWEEEKKTLNSGFSADGKVWTQADEDALNEAKARRTKLADELKLHSENLEKDKAAHEAQLMKRSQERALNAYTEDARTTARGKLEKLDKESKTFAAEESKIVSAEEVTRLENHRDALKSFNAAYIEEAKTAGAERKKALESIIEQNKEQIAQIEGQIKPATEIGSRGTPAKTKGDGSGGRKESPLGAIIARLKADNAELSVAVSEFEETTDSSISAYERAWAKYESLWKSGKFNYGKNNKTSPKMGDVATAAWEEAQKEILTNAQKFVQQYNNLIVNNADDVNDAWQKILDPLGVQGRAASTNKLDDFFAKLEKDTVTLQKFLELTKNNSIADLKKTLYGDDATKRMGSFIQSIAIDEKKLDIEGAYAMPDADRRRALFELEMNRKRVQFEELKKSMESNGKDITAAASAWEKYEKASRKALDRETMSQVEKLGEQWANVTDRMNESTARWANNFMDSLVELTTTGKTDWRKFVLGMATDMERMLLQEMFGKGITKMFGGIGEALTGAMTGKGKDGEGLGGIFTKLWGGIKDTAGKLFGLGDSAKAASEATGEQTTSIIDSLLGITTKQTAEQAATSSLLALAQAANAASVALGGQPGAVSGGGGSGWGSLISGAFSLAGAYFGYGGGGDISAGNYNTLMTTDAGSMTSAADSAAIAADLGDTAWFANGGIMTKFGELPLRKYANGGVANQPQAAIFGEGSMNEAFVPLPDGRSIPVTMDISGTGGVTNNQIVNISVVVNKETGNEKTESTGDDKDGYRKMAAQIKNVVLEQLIAQKRPGGVLYGG